MRSGWSGPMATDVQAVDYLGARLQSEGKHRAAIGYQTYIAEFMAAMNIAILATRSAQSSISFSSIDTGSPTPINARREYPSVMRTRIVQEPPKSIQAKPRAESWMPLGAEVKTYDLVEHFDVPWDPRFRLLQRFGEFAVFQRTGP